MPPLPANPGKCTRLTNRSRRIGSALVQLAELDGMTAIGAVRSAEKASPSSLRSGPTTPSPIGASPGRPAQRVSRSLGTRARSSAGMPDKNKVQENVLRSTKTPAVRRFSFHRDDQDPTGAARSSTTCSPCSSSERICPAIAQRMPLDEVGCTHERPRAVPIWERSC
jgi:hypothetical protein